VALQDVLGEMQDRTVLHETALRLCGEDGVDSAAGLPPALAPDLARFLRYGDYRRRRLLYQARARWVKLETEHFFENLMTSLL
jgi:hypothetical protein